MIGFYRDGSSLVCDGVALDAIAASAGTPVYVYSAAWIRHAFRTLDESLAPHPHALHYALKANSALAIARLIRQIGGGADANSGGEIEVALRAGFLPSQITFTGVGKTTDEIERAVDLGVATINAESAGELDRIDAIAGRRGTRARVAVRINPDIDARSHPHISTGLATSKFGVPLDEARELCRRMAARAGLAIAGVHVHVGSQILDVGPLSRAARAAVALATELRDDGLAIDRVDLGGGLGISYGDRPAPTVADYATAVLDAVRGTGLVLVLEPGRAIVGPAGALVARVIDVKPSAQGRQFAVLDAGMTELLRPAMYGAYHRIELVSDAGREARAQDVVGPVCESSDVLARDRTLPELRVGDLVAILDAGAYGAVMASNYNRRPLPAEVLVDDSRWRVIRRRQSVEDLIALED